MFDGRGIQMLTRGDWHPKKIVHDARALASFSIH